MADFREIKKEIRKLRKLKLSCRPGTPERLDLEHSIKELKKQLLIITEIDPKKEKLIAEILKLEINLSNLNKFSVEQLQYHLDKIKKRDSNSIRP